MYLKKYIFSSFFYLFIYLFYLFEQNALCDKVSPYIIILRRALKDVRR